MTREVPVSTTASCMAAKGLGVAVVVLACAALGMFKAEELQLRLQQLREWQRLLLLLEQEVIVSTPLPDALMRIKDGANQHFAAFLGELEAALRGNRGLPFATLFALEAKKHLRSSSLTAEDLRQMEQMAEIMGSASRELQLKLLKREQAILEQQIGELFAQLPVKQRLFRSLGILGGAFLGVLLL